MTDAPLIASSPADIPSRELLLSMSGLEYMQKMVANEVPHPTNAGVMGYRITHAEHGRVMLEGAASFVHTNPFGGVHGGWYGLVLDTALGSVVMTAVPKGRWYTTLEYKINITRALPVGMKVMIEAVLDHAGRSTAVAHGTIRGKEDGRLYATGTTTCIIMG